MKLRYGSYTHADNECAVVISKDSILGEDNQPVRVRERWDVVGQLHADSTSELTTAINALATAYSNDKGDIALLTSTGGGTAHVMLTNDTINGTRVVQRPSFPRGTGAEYTTWRNYTLAVEGDYAVNDTPLLSWRESITMLGNGTARWDYQVPLVGVPISQMHTQCSLVTVIQEGYAVGYLAYVTPPEPIWPSQELGEYRRITTEVPAKDAPERRVSWTYMFRAPAPLGGLPHAR